MAIKIFTIALTAFFMSSSLSIASNDNPSIHAAVIMNDFNLANYYLRNGGKIDAVNNKGGTALMLATELCKDKFVEYLISKGANTCAQNPQGHTAIDNACSQQAINVIKKNQEAAGCKLNKSLGSSVK